MKSGMKVELNGLGEAQVIGEVKDGKFVEVWGIGLSASGRAITNIDPELLKDVLEACQKAHNNNILSKAKMIQSDDRPCLDLIAEAQDKINKEVTC